MTDTIPHQAPTAKQLRYLRSLARRVASRSPTPAIGCEASAEIERLKSRRPGSYIERRIERDEVSRDMAARGDAASCGSQRSSATAPRRRWRSAG